MYLLLSPLSVAPRLFTLVSSMKKSLKTAGFFSIGASLFILAAELVLRQFPVILPTSLSPGIDVGRAAMHEANSSFVYSRDWDFLLARRGQIGPHGFHGVCALAKKGNKGIFILGDSFTEGLMLSPEKSLGGKMQAALPDERVCAAGMSGASASEYLSQLDELTRLGDGRLVLVVLNRPDFLESFAGREGLAKFDLSEEVRNPKLIGGNYQRPDYLTRMYFSSFFRYVYYNLD